MAPSEARVLGYVALSLVAIGIGSWIADYVDPERKERSARDMAAYIARRDDEIKNGPCRRAEAEARRRRQEQADRAEMLRFMEADRRLQAVEDAAQMEREEAEDREEEEAARVRWENEVWNDHELEHQEEMAAQPVLQAGVQADNAEMRRFVEAEQPRQAAKDEAQMEREEAEDREEEEAARIRWESEVWNKHEHERQEGMAAQHVLPARAHALRDAAAATDATRNAESTSDLPPPSAAISFDTLEPGERWRRKADEQMKLRDEASRLSQEAYKMKEGAEAKELSEVRKGHDTQMRSYHAKAAAEIFAHHNPEYHANSQHSSDRNSCDLHGLYLKEAMQYAKGHLAICKDAGVDRTCFITGIGNRSDTGPKLKPALEKMLMATGLIVQKGVPNKGRITVQFHSGAER